jgi:hypothetical protein
LVAVEPGYEVNVQMSDGLACGRAIVDADVVALGSQFVVEGLLCFVQQLQDPDALSSRQFEEAAYVSARDDQ